VIKTVTAEADCPPGEMFADRVPSPIAAWVDSDVPGVLGRTTSGPSAALIRSRTWTNQAGHADSGGETSTTSGTWGRIRARAISSSLGSS